METCYRHPDRETGVSCSNCGRPICPDCMTTTSVGMRCPECAQQKTKVSSGISRSSDDPVLTYILIGINVAVALGGFLSGGNAASGGFGSSSLLSDGSVSRFTIEQGEYWRLITAGFLHAGFAHLLFNMFSLWILGSIVEPAVGRLRFGLIYFVSLLAGSFGALLLEPTAPTVGASGAIFGLMGAAIVVMRHAGINPLQSGLGFWLGLNLLFTFTAANISIGGHIGGLIGGALAAFVLFDLRDRLRVPAAVATGITVALGVAAVVGAIAVSSSPAA
jgi:membrane associated rhomboid family serine protease